jgi:hypothetical protein
MIDWRVWLLSAIARKFGLTYHVVGQHALSGERVFIFAASETTAYGIALQFCLQQQQARADAAAAADLPDYAAAESLH